MLKRIPFKITLRKPVGNEPPSIASLFRREYWWVVFLSDYLPLVIVVTWAVAEKYLPRPSLSWLLVGCVLFLGLHLTAAWFRHRMFQRFTWECHHNIRCCGCGYSLRGLPPGEDPAICVCPECGLEHKRDLHEEAVYRWADRQDMRE